MRELGHLLFGHRLNLGTLRTKRYPEAVLRESQRNAELVLRTISVVRDALQQQEEGWNAEVAAWLQEQGDEARETVHRAELEAQRLLAELQLRRERRALAAAGGGAGGAPGLTGRAARRDALSLSRSQRPPPSQSALRRTTARETSTQS